MQDLNKYDLAEGKTLLTFARLILANMEESNCTFESLDSRRCVAQGTSLEQFNNMINRRLGTVNMRMISDMLYASNSAFIEG